MLTVERLYRTAVARSLTEVPTSPRISAAQSFPRFWWEEGISSPIDSQPCKTVLAAAAIKDDKAAEGDSAA